MITLKEDGTLESITFNQDGWYDCCSGHWFLHYNLLDVDGELFDTFGDVSECYWIALKVREFYSINSVSGLETTKEDLYNYINKGLSDNYDVLNLFDEDTVVEFLGRELEHYGVDVVIKLDESIDLNYSTTCYD